MSHPNFENVDMTSLVFWSVSSIISVFGLVSLQDWVMWAALGASATTVLLNLKKFFTKNKE